MNTINSSFRQLGWKDPMVGTSHVSSAALFRIAVVLAATCLMSPRALAALQISDGTTQNVTCVSGVCSATAQSSVLNVDDLSALLADGDVSVVSGSAAENIQIKAALSWTSVSRLTLDSYKSVAFDDPVTVVGSGALTITTNDGGHDGDFSFSGKGRVEFADLQSSLFINGRRYQLF